MQIGEKLASSTVWEPSLSRFEPSLYRILGCLLAGMILHCCWLSTAYRAIKELNDSESLASDNQEEYALGSG